jgi:tellurite resistance protein TerC
MRALYFALAGITKYFYYLKYGLSAILVFVGIEMVVAKFYKIPVVYSLLTILGILVISILFSVVFPKKGNHLYTNLKINNYELSKL